MLLVQKGVDGQLYTMGPQRDAYNDTSPLTTSADTNPGPKRLSSDKERVSFIKLPNQDGSEGLQMLIEDLNTSLKRTITYVLDDVIEEQDL